jgi:pantoate--beta-alanine ligase
LSEIPLVRTAGAVRELVRAWRAFGDTIALVPTMGNLHDGHLSLVKLARHNADRVVVSIYVNPTQFGPNEDLAAYPRTLSDDAAMLAEAHLADALFAPDDREIYPFGVDEAVRLQMPAFSRELCGASRPGHFDGVASVVCRLLNIVTPETVVLGRKDYQQLKILEYLIADLRMTVRALAGETLRHPDGLAMSSRNRYLTSDERGRAPALHATLVSLKSAVDAGWDDYAALEADAVDALSAAGFKPDYVEVRSAADLSKPAEGAAPDGLIVLAAAWLGRARLIDNLALGRVRAAQQEGAQAPG